MAAQALDRSWLLVAETAGRRAAEQLGTVASALARATDLTTVGEVAVTHARSALAAGAVVVLVRDGSTLRPLGVEGFSGGSGLATDATHPLAGAVRDGEPIWDAAAADSAYPIHIAVPLLVGGQVVGVLGLRFPTAPTFTSQRRNVAGSSSPSPASARRPCNGPSCTRPSTRWR